MKNALLIPFISIVILSHPSCIKSVDGECEEARSVEQSEIGITFKDAAGNYFYEETNPIYNKDSLKVFDQDGRSLVLLSQLKEIPNTYRRYYEVSFGPVY